MNEQHTVEEIISQPTVWETVLQTNGNGVPTTNGMLGEISNHRFAFVGSGTSYYLSLSAAAIWKHITNRAAVAVPSAEIIFYDQLYTGTRGMDSAVLISRSGTTTEILRAGETLSQSGTNRISLTCRAGSPLSQLGEYRYLIEAADEKSVVMTRSFTSMLLLIQILAARLAENQVYLAQLHQLPELGSALLQRYAGFCENLIDSNRFEKFIYLGHGPHFGLASEGMLKIKEMSIANSEAYHSLEYRHGPMSLADKRTLIVYLLSDRTADSEIKLVGEMKALGASSLVICETATPEILAVSDHVVEIGSGLDENARLILTMPILQQLAYQNAMKKNLDPDRPKNLTQVVTQI